MTSNPASRSARATTFAPRSCPSRPGFAMTMRVGRLTGRSLSGAAEAPRRCPRGRRDATLVPMARRFRFRPPGLKPTTKVGTLGPYRGRLGLAWVIAPIVAGAVILLAGWLALR